MRIDIYSDTICPWCFIGKRRLERALIEQPQPDIDFTWRTFQLNPDMPAEGMARERYLSLKFGGPVGAKRVYDPVRQAGQEEGIAFAFDQMTRTPNTLASHRLIRKAGELDCQTEVVQALFDAYFLKAEDIGEIDVLVRAAVAGGLNEDSIRGYLESDEDLAAVREEDAEARRIGIQGVPTYILNGKYVLSGAHPPEVLHQMFELGRQDDSTEVEAEA
ncbi:MAG: DsbA family oxidoreductase [Pseudomonadota bacterium]